jgi:high-affinity nickel permease
MNQTVFAIFGLGFLLGLRHALEPDHVLAVSTIVSRNNSIVRSSLAGTLWGLGHTTSLLICGCLVLALRLSIPESFVAGAETAVAVMLMVLGVNALWQWVRASTLHIHFHTHDGRRHIHFHAHPAAETAVHTHRHIFKAGIRPFLIGMVHGLAGSGALMILVVTAVPSFVTGLIYILLFGFGSIGGMLLLSSVISIPFVLSAGRYHMVNNGLQLVTALLSIGAGLFWISL